MGDIGSKSCIEAAQSYERKRQLFLFFNFAYDGCFVGFMILMVFASSKNWDALGGTLFLLFIPASCVFGLGSFLTSCDLRAFRCPRCGKRFAVSWLNTWPTNRCKHCRLDLGQAVMTKVKPSSATKIWE